MTWSTRMNWNPYAYMYLSTPQIIFSGVRCRHFSWVFCYFVRLESARMTFLSVQGYYSHWLCRLSTSSGKLFSLLVLCACSDRLIVARASGLFQFASSCSLLLPYSLQHLPSSGLSFRPFAPATILLVVQYTALARPPTIVSTANIFKS